MASQISHLALVESILPQLPEIKDVEAFAVGAVFPDIRYQAQLDRRSTHLDTRCLDEVRAEPDPCRAGMRFHVLCDLVRERFMTDRNAYRFCPPIEGQARAMKLNEDIFIYPQMRMRERFLGALTIIYAAEQATGLGDAALKRWHTTVATYVGETPSPITRRAFLLPLGFPEHLIPSVEAAIAQMQRQEALTELIREFFERAPELLRAAR